MNTKSVETEQEDNNFLCRKKVTSEMASQSSSSSTAAVVAAPTLISFCWLCNVVLLCFVFPFVFCAVFDIRAGFKTDHSHVHYSAK